ncbi:signal recognition particle subunit SRP19, partial [Lecanoromycetidae sp. Uapishka_2]
MAHHARIEELSDSDPDSDPPEDDIDDIAPALIRPSSIPAPNTRHPPQPQQQPPSTNNTQPPEYKHYQCIYPLYFDSNRSRAEGRRVGMELAVENPLAREIVDAVQLLGLKTVFEPGKMHPKDWSNPGRVRVLVKENGKARSAKVKNKHHLYRLISDHLKAHPTTPETPLRLRIQGMPPPDGPPQPPAVPRGWKMGTVLPLHSPALSGGGVSENILKDVMQEMQGAGQGGGMG